MTTLEQDFAKAKATHTQNVRFEAERWAAWLCMAREELGDFPDILSVKEDECDHWNPRQKNLFHGLLHCRDITFSEIKELIVEIGNVDEIWNVCFEHICYMYAFCFVEEEAVDRILDQVKECDQCNMWLSAFAYQVIALGRPLSMSDMWHMAHCGSDQVIWSFITAIENDVMCEKGFEFRLEAADAFLPTRDTPPV